MTDKLRVVALLDKYMEYFPEEKNILTDFSRFVKNFNTKELYDRKNFVGHITVSAIVTDSGCRNFLLLNHRQLGKWLQPGGHVEVSDTDLLCGAFREVEEETGLGRELFDVMRTPDGLNVVDFDSHHIPRSDTKREEEHFHHDVRFLFRLKGPVVALSIDEEESTGYKWVTRDRFPDHFGITRLIPKIDLFTEVTPPGEYCL